MVELETKQQVKVLIERLDKDLELPTYAKEDDAAMDLRSSEDVKFLPGEKKIVKTGVKMAIPRGYAGLIWDRSGMAAKHSMHTMAGVIDSGYRGEIGIVLVNLGKEDFYIEKGMRIAQILIQPVLNTFVEEVDKLEENTERGAGGFGSSGFK
ncbi:hypothetical protein BVX95_02345 [archaeon D22]|nr:hypothetical protein BVX95_02345 [archaeon D22]